jgi:hypothetical protein
MNRLLRRLKADLPPFRHTELRTASTPRPHYVIDCPDSPSGGSVTG